MSTRNKELPRRSRPSGGAVARAVDYLAEKAIRHLPPFAVWLAEWPVAWAAHQQWGGSTVAASALTLAAVGLTGVTYRTGMNLERQRQLQATATTGAATGWFAAAAIAGPTAPELVNTWLMGGPVVALAWSIRAALRNDDAKTSGDSGTKSLWEKIGLARARAGEIRVEPNKVTVPVELDRGAQTHDDAAKAAKNLAGALGVSPNAVGWRGDPEDAARGEYVIIPEDMLKEPTPWPGPSAPGGSIGDAPIPLGIYEDGPPCAIWFHGDEASGRNASHYQFMGMTGAGKSQGGRVILADLMTRRDVVVWGADPSKGMQTFGPIVGGMDWAAFTMADCRAQIAAMPAVITARADELGRHGYDQWTPEAGARLGMPYLVWWIEEAAKLFREGEDLLPIVQEARSAGISVVISLQRSSHTVMDTDVRANLGGATCFGVNGPEDAGMALSDDTIDAGAHPETWRNRKPGYCYCEGPGIEPDRFATAVRSYFQDKEHAASVIAQYAPVRPKDAGRVTARAAGPAYANRTRHDPTTEPATPAQESSGPAADPDIDPDTAALFATDPEYADIRVDPDRELPPVPPGFDMPLPGAAPVGQVSREQALNALEEVLQEFTDRGQTEFGPKDITPYLDRIGKTGSWVRRELRRLAEEGTVEDTEQAGIYRIRVLEAA
ncbi:conjugal transfer protein TraB [Streptomyces sp. PT12]|uniref:conjugal transfer protein TraB n=1 Tax=Streptomyces sp. PT12 TaxID=1510197 RepID=UPI000DE20C6C|nr:conjugal transfer protein TraB [Streptomyces sp. PT12]RBM05652.1 conjugal transfer protein TraB [Streptomyces sp. PT12]